MSDKREWTAERHAAATARCAVPELSPAPWIVRDDCGGRGVDRGDRDNIGSDRFILNEGANGRYADLAFAAHARVDLPDALRKIERLKCDLSDIATLLNGRLAEATAENERLAQRLATETARANLIETHRKIAGSDLDKMTKEAASLRADLLLLGALKSAEVAPVIERFREAFGADVPQAPSGQRALTRDRAREIGLRAMSPAPGRIPEGIVDQVEDAILRAAAGEFGAPCEPAKGDGVGCSREPGCEVEP